MNQINIKRLKSSLTIEDHKKICKQLNIPAFSENSNQIIYFTADKHFNGYDGSAKLVFYKDTGIYIGYTSAKSYDIISLVQQRLSILKKPSSFMDAVNLILSVTGKQVDSVKRVKEPHIYNWEDSLGKFLRFRQTGTTLKTYNENIINQFSNILPTDWIDEGITVNTLEKYQIKYYDRLNATVIPCRDKCGNLIGIRCRHWKPNEIEQGKYRPLTTLEGNTYKFNTNNVFFGINYNWPEIERTGKVFLVESEKAVMKLDSFYSEHNVALGMFGHNLGLKRRNELIKLGVKHVIYVPDNDWIGSSKEAYDTWEKQVVTFCKQFNGYAKVEIVWDNLGLLDPKENATDKDKDIWLKLYNNREEF